MTNIEFHEILPLCQFFLGQFYNGSLEFISDQDQSTGGLDNLNDYFDFLEYLFYPPTFFLGPVITYDAFDSPPKDLVPTQGKLTAAIIE